MAVHDHPRYAEWSDALDKLKEANDCYRAVRTTSDRLATESLRKNFAWAQTEYNRISEEINA